MIKSTDNKSLNNMKIYFKKLKSEIKAKIKVL